MYVFGPSKPRNPPGSTSHYFAHRVSESSSLLTDTMKLFGTGCGLTENNKDIDHENVKIMSGRGNVRHTFHLCKHVFFIRNLEYGLVLKIIGLKLSEEFLHYEKLG